MATRDTEFAVRTKGLGALNRSLGKIDKDMRKRSVGKLRDIAKKVRADARPLAPVKTGKLAGSFRYSASNRGASVSSNLPQAGVHEFGGTISPRGVPITIKRSRMLGRAVEKDTAHIERELEALFEQVARSAGFR